MQFLARDRFGHSSCCPPLLPSPFIQEQLYQRAPVIQGQKQLKENCICLVVASGLKKDEEE